MSPAAAAESPTATGEVDTERPQETANENTALLSNNNNDYEDGRLKRDLDAITAEDVGAEIIHLVQMSWPVSLGYILTQVLGLTSLFFIGQYIDTQHLAAVALATMFANVTGFSIGIGMSTALDTLCAQSHTGSDDPYALGKHLQRGLVVTAFLTIPISVVWLFAEKLLVLAGQDADIASLSSTYLMYLIPGIFPYIAYECLKRFLQGQGIMRGILFVLSLACPVNALLQWLFVGGPLGLGLIGSAVALSITYWLLPIFLCCFIFFFNQGRDAWGGWEFKEALNLRQIGELCRLGVPGILMLCAEWWAFEVVALAAGWIGEKELAAQSIILTTSATAYMLPLGVSIAASTKIGNALGSGCPNRAKAGSRASLILALIVSSFNSIFFIAVKDVWGYLWVKDDEILVHIIATVLPLAALFQLNDGINGIGGGILRGCGHQKWGAVFNLSGYYLVGIPSGLAFAFSSLRLGLFGLWAGLTIALFLVSVCQLVWIYNIDWENEVDIAREKMRSMTSLIDEET